MMMNLKTGRWIIFGVVIVLAAAVAIMKTVGDNGGHSPGESKACYAEVNGIQTSTSQAEYW